MLPKISRWHNLGNARALFEDSSTGVHLRQYDSCPNRCSLRTVPSNSGHVRLVTTAIASSLLKMPIRHRLPNGASWLVPPVHPGDRGQVGIGSAFPAVLSFLQYSATPAILALAP